MRAERPAPTDRTKSKARPHRPNQVEAPAPTDRTESNAPPRRTEPSRRACPERAKRVEGLHPVRKRNAHQREAGLHESQVELVERDAQVAAGRIRFVQDRIPVI